LLKGDEEKKGGLDSLRLKIDQSLYLILLYLAYRHMIKFNFSPKYVADRKK